MADDTDGGISGFGSEATGGGGSDASTPPPQDPPPSKDSGAAQPEVRRAEPVDPDHQATEDAIQQEMRLRKEAATADDQHAKNVEWKNQQVQKLYSDPGPKMPSFDEAYPAPKAAPAGLGRPSKQEMQRTGLAYLAVAIPLTIAIGLSKHGNALGALQGLAEGYQAINNGYDEKAKYAAQLWKQQNDAATKTGEHHMAYYKDIIANRKTTLEEKMKMIDSQAEASKDTAMAKHAAAGDWHNIVETLQNREKLMIDVKKFRRDNEDKIMKQLGNGAEYEDYKQQLAQKNPKMQEALQKGDNDAYFNEYNEAIKKYTWQTFLEEKQAKAVKDAAQKAHDEEAGRLKAKKEAGGDDAKEAGRKSYEEEAGRIRAKKEGEAEPGASPTGSSAPAIDDKTAAAIAKQLLGDQ